MVDDAKPCPQITEILGEQFIPSRPPEIMIHGFLGAAPITLHRRLCCGRDYPIRVGLPAFQHRGRNSYVALLRRYVPNPFAYFEKLSRERHGISELKFKRGDRVRFNNATEVQYGIVSEISPKREMFAVAWDYSDNRRWHTVFDQHLFDVVP